jgi:hypothetical protein
VESADSKEVNQGRVKILLLDCFDFGKLPSIRRRLRDA